MGLKFLESEILKNDSNYRSISKYLKSINTVFEKFKEIKDLPFSEINSKNREDFLFQLKNFKKLNVNNLRKFDIMNSLTLKSEYSDDFSEMASSILNEDMKNIINCVTETNTFHKELPSEKPNDTVNEIINDLTRVRTEDEKIKMKNGKKIKNKKLKYSNTNSDLDITENKRTQKDVIPKIKSWNKDLKILKSKNSFNTKITPIHSITSPRFNSRSNVSANNLNQRNPTNFSQTHSVFRVDSKLGKNTTPTNKVNSLIEKVKISNKNTKDEASKLSGEIFDLKETAKSSSLSPYKKYKEESKEIMNIKDSTKEDNTFSPSTSSQCKQIVKKLSGKYDYSTSGAIR